MRSKRYVTMLDPFQHRYGNMFTATLLLPALVSDILWVACILAALGKSHLRYDAVIIHHITVLFTISHLMFCVISRRNDEHNSWAVVCPLHHYLGSCLHHLHIFRGSLLRGVY